MNDEQSGKLPAVMDTVEQEAAHYAHAVAHEMTADVEQRISDAYHNGYFAGFHDARISNPT